MVSMSAKVVMRALHLLAFLLLGNLPSSPRSQRRRARSPHIPSPPLPLFPESLSMEEQRFRYWICQVSLKAPQKGREEGGRLYPLRRSDPIHCAYLDTKTLRRQVI